MRFRFSRRAEIDIEGIGDFIARDNPRRALSFVMELRSRCRALADFPEAFPLCPEFGEGVRLAVHNGNYLIFYLVHGDLLEIRRVIHGARDWLAHSE
ncbi:MAG TPA: type II toxin-antitoxin system RelE/ParE family toxin [Stellaceae bacterium]